ERTVIAERPSVVVAAERVGVAAVGRAQPVASVCAAVVQHAHLAVPAARDDQRVAADPAGYVVARFGDLAFMRDVDPTLAEDAAHLHLEGLLRGVDRSVHLVGSYQRAHVLRGERAGVHCGHRYASKGWGTRVSRDLRRAAGCRPPSGTRCGPGRRSGSCGRWAGSCPTRAGARWRVA